ncbi:DUF4440 domain-containing protein [Streptomyces sp. NPDC051041]|uniref:DUF4440 domain-containing protein n=1 Tax=Streptomyces sp. NPDC051041 TaxID=3365640 RepID=UPI003792C1AB
MADRDPAVEAAVRGEPALLGPEVRRSPERVAAPPHPGFHGFGASGRHGDRAPAAAMPATATAPGARPPAVSRTRGVRLAPDPVRRTLGTEHQGRRVHRGSLWRRAQDGRRPYVHQGTPFDAREE